MASAVKKTEKAEPAAQKPVKQKKDLFHYLKILILPCQVCNHFSHTAVAAAQYNMKHLV